MESKVDLLKKPTPVFCTDSPLKMSKIFESGDMMILVLNLRRPPKSNVAKIDRGQLQT